MTTKTPGRNPQEQPEAGPAQRELRVAYQVHTLAQMLYGELVAAHPWMHGHPAMSLPVTMPAPMGMVAIDPTMAPMTAPWTARWAAPYCNPVGPTGPATYSWNGPYGFYGTDLIPR